MSRNAVQRRIAPDARTQLVFRDKTMSKTKTITEILGPVDNLESYVKADWWRHLFNANYLRTDGDVVEDIEITKNEIDLFIAALDLQENAHILDLCCGQGRHALELAKRGYPHITGLDQSHYLIGLAKKRNKQAGLQVQFREGDSRQLRFPSGSFDVVIIAGNSFGYFESVMDDIRVLEEIKRVLKPAGKLLIDATDGQQMQANFEPRSWEWIDKNYFVCRERSLSKNSDRLISRETITHVAKGVIADQFYAERLYTFDDLHTLLTEVGFTNIREHTKLATASKRAQDLGMMAARIILTATIQKERAPVRQLTAPLATVIVIMGDPDKQDLVKPTAKFDDNDFYTINELKTALAQVKRYNFIYLNRHDTLIQDLQRLKTQCSFVLNLCDEGLNNEPQKELHISALLEMLGVPYSGGNPRCLAYCYDKSLVRVIAKEMNLPVPKTFMIKPEDSHFMGFQLNFPVIAKPNFGDGSFGITTKSVCYDLQALENAIMQARDDFGNKEPILVEEFLTGKELGVGIIGNPPTAYTVLPITEEDFSCLPEGLPQICGYEGKWDPNSPYWQIKSIPANLPEEVKEFLVTSCLKLFERLECRDYARFDWRLDAKGTPRLLEVNPNPSWCWDGHLAKMATLQGISYCDMLKMILETCEHRIALPTTPRDTA